MRKTILVMAFLLVVLSFSVSARRAENFSATDAYGWLIEQSKNGSYNDDIMDTAAAFLAINVAGGLTTAEKDYLISKENENYCWPKAGCKIKDTVWAVLAMQKAEESSYVTDAESWLKKAQTPTLTGGNWWLEIDTPDTGTCKIKYTKGTTEISKDVKVSAGTFPDCKSKVETFFDLKNCLESGLLSSFASLDLDVDCSTLSSAKISIAYNSGSSYYLYQEVSESNAKITVKNGCFSTSYKGTSCDYESSLLAEWAMNQLGSSLSSELYLRENYDPKNAMHNALLYLVTKDKAYLDQLKKSQKSDGSWDGSSVYTAFAILALKPEGDSAQLVEKAQEWLKIKQMEDGSWDSKVFNTALVLYSSFYEGVELPSCNDGIKNQGEKGVDCGGPCEDDCCDNGIKDIDEEGIDCGGVCEPCQEAVCNDNGACDEARGEDCNNCPADCKSCEALCSDGVTSTDSAEEGVDCGGLCLKLFNKECSNICNNDGKCDIDLVDRGYESNEDGQKCPKDCACGDEVCDDYERESGTCTQDCPTTAAAAECGDGICSEGEDVSCSQDCAQEVCNNDGTCDLKAGEGCGCSDCAKESFCTGKTTSNLKWILILLAILIVGGGAYFFLTSKKGPKEPSYGLYGRGTGPISRSAPEKPGPKGSFFSSLLTSKQPTTPQRSLPPSKTEGKSALDEEIESSIKEAKKLIKEEK